MELPARYYARAAEVLLRLGIDVPAVLRAADIHPERVSHPDATVKLEQVEALVAEILKRSTRSDLGMEVGRALKLSSHSLVGYGMLSSPHADHALRLASRFFPLIMPAFRMRYRANGRRAEIRFQPAMSMSHACFTFHLEALAAATHFELRELLAGRMPDCDLYFSVPEPPHAARYAELIGARCHFGWEGSPGVRLIFAADFSDHALPLHDPTSLKMAEMRCSDMLRRSFVNERVSDWVSMMLREAGTDVPTLDELARILNLSARTLDRQLNREGARYRNLLTRIRHDKACALLEAGELSITRIAYELGYTDAANFTRAFRREAGVSPRDYRTAKA